MKEKIIALFLTAIMAATYFNLVLAANDLGTYPAPFCSGGVCNFYTVVGSKAQATDVVGSGDVIARLAGENYVLTSTTGGTTTAVTGEGARLDTANNRILFSEGLNNARTSLTSTDLPTLLKGSEVTDDNGNTFAYTQDITIDNDTSVTFGTSGGDIKDPVIYLSLPTTATSTGYIYSTRITFSKLLNISSDTVVDNTIKLFGSEYTIGSGSTSATTTEKLILYGGANTVTLKEGEEQKVTIGGVEYTIKVEGVSSATVGVVSVNGETVSVVQGGSYKKSGLDVYISAIYYYSKEAQVSSMKLSLGSQKITLEDGSEVLFGTTDYVDNTLVSISGTAGQGISKVEIFVAAQDSEYDDIQIGKSYSDPVWKTFKLEFSSTTPALDDTNADSIVMSYSGDRLLTLKFQDYYKNENTLEFAYNNVSALTSTPTVYLMDSNSYYIGIKEGDPVLYKHYVVVNQGDETHLLQLTNIPSGPVKSTDTVRFKDVLTGATYEKTIVTTDCTATYCNVSMPIGSQTYYVALYNQSTKAAGYVKVTWNDITASSGDSGADYTLAGKITVFPGIKAKDGEYIYFVNNYTTFTCGDNAIVPSAGTTATAVNINCTLSNTNIYSFTAGQFSYNLYNTSATAAVLQMTKLNTSRAGIAILEEKQADGSTQGVVYLPIGQVGTTSFKLAVGTPLFSDTVFTAGTAGVTLGSNSYITKYYDVYGTQVSKDTTGDQGKITVTYPDDQLYTNIFLLTNEAVVSSAATGAGTIKKVVPLSDSVSKLDTDITDPATVKKNLVLIGGSCANPLVQKLVDSGKLDAKFTCTGGVPGAGWETGKGYIIYVADAFATGYDAIVIAGTDAIDTRNACSVIQKYDNTEIAAKLTAQTAVAVTSVSGAGVTPLA